MSMLMRAYCERLRKHIELPPGFTMEVEGNNIIVSNGKLAFCHTRERCVDSPTISWLASLTQSLINKAVDLSKSV